MVQISCKLTHCSIEGKYPKEGIFCTLIQLGINTDEFESEGLSVKKKKELESGSSLRRFGIPQTRYGLYRISGNS
jgi:hypothetical protein